MFFSILHNKFKLGFRTRLHNWHIDTETKINKCMYTLQSVKKKISYVFILYFRTLTKDPFYKMSY